MNGTEQDGAAAPPVTADRADARPDIPAPRRGAPSLVTLLTNPRAFFDALDERPASLRTPFLIVLVVGLIGAVAAYQVSAVLMNAMAIPGVQGLGGVIGVIGGLSALIFTLLFWVIITAAFFVISMAFKGRGDFNRLLSYVGYGHLPQAFGGIVSLALTWSYLSNLRIPPLTTPEAITEWTSTLMKDPTMRLATIVGLLFLLWSTNIWIFGVRNGRKLSTRDAAITVGLPVLVYILVTIVPSLVS